MNDQQFSISERGMSPQSKCQFCPYTTPHANRMRRHVNQIHLNVRDAPCPKCDFRAGDEQELKMHLQTKHGFVANPLFHLKSCAADGTNVTEGTGANDTTPANKKFKCPECNFSAADHLELLNHALSNHDEKKAGGLKCESCGFSTSDKQKLRKHETRQHGDKFKCGKCEYSTSDSYNYKMHIRKHEKVSADTKKEEHFSEAAQEEYKCEQCEYSTCTLSILKLHRKQKHKDMTANTKSKDDIEEIVVDIEPGTILESGKSEDAKQRHQYDKCDYSGSSEYNLKRHMRRRHKFKTSDKDQSKMQLSAENGKTEDDIEVIEDKPTTENSEAEEDVSLPHEYKCYKCDHSTTDKHQLQRHNARMHEELLECQKCEFKGDKHSLMRHTKDQHGRLKCEKCDYTTRDNINLRRHTESKHAGPFDEINKITSPTLEFNSSSKCEKCDYEYKGTDKRKLPEHVARMHGKILNCQKCDFSGDKHSYLKHQKIHRGTKGDVFMCEKCDYSSGDSNNLRWHVNQMHEDKPDSFNCDQCDFCTSHKRNLLRHVRRMHGKSSEHTESQRKENDIIEQDKLKCDQCDYRTYLLSYLKQHLTRMHSSSDKLEYTCEKCDHSTSDKWRLKDHMLKMHNRAIFCSDCDFIGDKYSFIKHRKTSHKDVVLECDKCEYVYRGRDKSKLKDHIANMHSKTINCPECEFEGDKHSYIQHKRNCHQGGKCDKCDYEYSGNDKSKLKDHIANMHSKMMSCPECEFEGDKHSYIQHKRNSHQGGKCDKCEYEYDGNDKSKLQKHIARMHEKIFNCPECSFTGDKFGYILHRRESHKGGNCDQCDYSTYDNYKLKKHKLRRHGTPVIRTDPGMLDVTNMRKTPIYEFKCDKCDYEYKGGDKRRLKLHQANMHDQVTKCPNCEFEGDKHSLLNHTRSFHKECIHELKCEKCDYEYKGKDKHRLQLHMANMHDKIVKCTECDFEGDKHTMVVHTKNFHKERKCTKCEYSSTDSYRYKKHLQRMHGIIRNCPKCSFQGDPYNLQVHWKSKHKKKRWIKVKDEDRVQCDECDFTANNKQLLLSHMRVHGLVITHKCDLCPYTASNQRRVRIHKRSIHDGIKDFKCGECSYASNKKWNLESHIKIVHRKIREFKCTLCSAEFSSLFCLKTHVKSVHEGRKDYKCNQCDYASSIRQSLLTHTKAVHDKIKDNFCDQCDYACPSKQMLKSHKKVRHDKVKDHKCDVCSYQTAFKSALAIHKKHVHDRKKVIGKRKKKFKCDFCSFETNFKHSLFNHKKGIHDKIKDFKCSQCTFESSYKTSLLLHERSVHKRITTAIGNRVTRLSVKAPQEVPEEPDPRKFKCEHCQFECRFKTSLILHERSAHNLTIAARPMRESRSQEEADLDDSGVEMESNNKKFSCTMCAFETNYKSSLLSHKKGVHFKLKPFQCDKCSYAAALKQNLVQHMRSHEVAKEECDLCPLKFKSKQNLRLHKQSKHAEMGERSLEKSLDSQESIKDDSRSSRSVRTSTRRQTQDLGIKNPQMKVEETSKPVKREDSDSENAESGAKKRKRAKATKKDQKEEEDCEPLKKKKAVKEEDDKKLVKEEMIGDPKCQLCEFTAPDFRALSEHYLHQHISGGVAKVKSE